MNIFISYAREDYDVAKRLFDSLKSVPDLNPWLDKENLLPGADWENEIFNIMENSQIIIVVLSSKSVEKTGFIQKELRKALDRFSYFPPDKIFLIPVRADSCTPKYRDLEKIQYVDIFPDWDNGFEKILQAIRSRLGVDLANIFQNYPNQWSGSSSRQKWLESNENYLKDFNAETIIEFLDGKTNPQFSTFMDELYAIDMMVKIAHRNHKDSLSQYVFRSHKIAKRMKYPHELPEAYGLVLNQSKLLSIDVRAMFLRELSDNNITYLTKTFLKSDLYNWGDELLLRDITKHFMVQEFDTRYGTYEIASTASKAFTWDIPYLDLMVFFARSVKNIDLLESLLPILTKGFQKARSDSFGSNNDDLYVSIPKRDNFRKPIDSDFAIANDDSIHFADCRENYQRLSLLLRIGEYLTYDNNNTERELYGINLRRIALEKLALSHSSISQTIQNMDKDTRMDFFKKLECLDDEGLTLYFPDKKERQLVRGLIKEWSTVWDEKAEELLPIKLDKDIFAN